MPKERELSDGFHGRSLEVMYVCLSRHLDRYGGSASGFFCFLLISSSHLVLTAAGFLAIKLDHGPSFDGI